MVSPRTLSLRRFGSRPQVHVDHVLGQGGQAIVYAARWDNGHGFQRSIALKVARRDAQSEALLKREAHISGALGHRHIVPVDDLIRLEGSLALVMGRVEGPDLRTVARGAARRGDRSIRAVLEVGRDIAAALDHLRAARLPHFSRPVTVVHRDLKPSNILIDSSGGARLADFGVAVVSGEHQYGPKLIAGTQGYMAPELVRGGTPSPASDVYALGATLLELVLLRRLRPRVGATEASTEAILRTAIAELPYRAAPVVMGRTARLLVAMLDPDPARRPRASSMVEALTQLARLAPGRPLVDWCVRTAPPRNQPDLLAWVGRSLPVSGRSSDTTETDLAEANLATLDALFNLPPVPPLALPMWAVA